MVSIGKFLFAVVLLFSFISCFQCKDRSSAWELLSDRLRSTQELTLRLALQPRNADAFTQKVHSIANPRSAEFRRYLKPQEIAEFVGRADDELELLGDWLSQRQLQVLQVTQHRDALLVKGTVQALEAAFNCRLGSWRNTISGEEKIGAVDNYSIPQEIVDVVDFIPGMSSSSFGRWRPIVQPTAAAEAEAAKTITPETIYSVYSSDSSGSHGSRLGSQAVIQFGRAANFNENDLQTFFSKYQPDLKGETCGTAYGENNGDIRGSVESNLDVQYVMAAGVYVNTSTYKFADSGNIEDAMVEYAMVVNDQTDPALVQSISYGEYGGSYDNTTVQRFNYELQKMAATGITVMLASGDNGVGCNSAGTSQEFDFPSSPYITMVGATYLDSSSGKEVGATLSSGGFSKDYYRPEWQDEAVAGYFASSAYKLHQPSEEFYADGRAYPDVAAFGQNVEVISAGSSTPVSGTSCSSPIFAGLVALLNSELLAAGEPPLGWINPWIYANPQMFTDITSGSNPYQRCDGFYAGEGWDPVTGMGTPIYSEMLKAAFLKYNNKQQQ